MLTHSDALVRKRRNPTMATATNGELLAASGPRNPYPGKLGVIEDGAHADLLVRRRRPAPEYRAACRASDVAEAHHERRQDLQE